MDLVKGAIGSLLPKLLELLGEEYKLQTGVKTQVQSLSVELESIHAFLCKVGDVPWYQLDEQVKVWAREVREASYDMEDVLDTFLVHVEGVPVPADTSMLKRAMNMITNLFRKRKAHHDIGCSIHDIKNRLREVAERRAKYNIDDIVATPAATTPAIDPRLQAMYKEVAHLVGIDKPRDDLISMLSSQVDDLVSRKKVVSIVGIGGLGKTTLAKTVYDKLRVDFDCGAFIPVGRNPNLMKVFMDILYDLDKSKYSDIHNTKKDTRQLIEDLREFLENQRYFVVIDDIWENESWGKIQLALFENNCGSRIITTTRNSQVASETGDEVYKMQALSIDNSKRLFYTRIFGDEVKCYDNQPDEVPNKILKKCDGIPLAIITMASLLVGKPREKWSDVFTSIGFGNKDNLQVDNTMKILSYSYYDMPSYLRTCLLYLTVFPEDYTIDKDSLIWKWIAEGFVQGKQGIRLFDLGEQYFNDLINRSMIQATESELNGMVNDCRIHDMVLDLIRSISSEENFVTILENDEAGTVSPPSCARRLAHHNKALGHAPHANMVGMTQVRSFIACRCAFDKLVTLSSFKLLRVLSMEGCKNLGADHLVHLENLRHLRYLGLEDTNIDELPNEIGALKFLQTLNLRGSKAVDVTASISQLTQLVCLKGYPLYRFTEVNSVGKLASLEYMEIMIPPPYGYAIGCFKALGNLRELRVLCLRWIHHMNDSIERDLVLCLSNLRKLQHLTMLPIFTMHADTAVWEQADFVLPRQLRFLDLSAIRFSWLPSCISAACLPNLSHLSLYVDAMDEEGLEFLGRLPDLIYLSLETQSTVTISNINVGNGCFKKLRFCNMPKSMIQFLCHEEDSSFSFHIWNGTDAMPFGYKKGECRVATPAIMPSVQVLEFCVYVPNFDGGNYDNVSLEKLTSLEKVIVHSYHHRASAEAGFEGLDSLDIASVEAALRRVVDVHPNRPTLRVS